MNSRRSIAAVACLLALFITLGGHWALLQSVAWGTMLVDFSRRHPWLEAVERTFSGEHPCSMCQLVESGRKQEQEQQREQPLIHHEKLPDFLSPLDGVEVRTFSCPLRLSTPFISALHLQFISTPPKPPPRA